MQVVRCNSLLVSSVNSRLCNSLSCVSINASDRLTIINPKKDDESRSLFWMVKRFNKRFAFHHVVLFRRNGRLLKKLRKHTISLGKLVKSSEKFKDLFPGFFVPIVLGMMLFMTITIPVSKSPSCKFFIFMFTVLPCFNKHQFLLYSEMLHRGFIYRGTH